MNFFKILGVVVVVTTGLPLVSYADYQDGEKAFQQGDYEKAFKEWLSLAEQEHVGSQFVIGILYVDGIGVKQSINEAVKWFRRAAKQEHMGAQFRLGLAYHEGGGVKQNYSEAVRWYSKAAKQGDADAQKLLRDGKYHFRIGTYYFFGKGVAENYTEAGKWYRKAAERGNIQAQFVLGMMYWEGMGVTPDLMQAHLWSSLAASSGNSTARKNRDSIAQSLSATQIARSKKLFRKWTSKLKHQFAQGETQKTIPKCPLILDSDYLKAVIDWTEWVTQTLAKKKLLMEDEKKDFRKSLYCYATTPNGKAIVKNFKGKTLEQKIINNLLKLFKEGKISAYNGSKEKFSAYNGSKEEEIPENLKPLFGKLASPEEKYLLEGTRLQQIREYDKAFKIFSELSDKGNRNAQYNLGFMYEKGQGTKKNIKKALQYYEKAASKKSFQAQQALSQLYYQGIEVKKDIEKAFKWMKQAADNDNPVLLDTKEYAIAQTTVGLQLQQGLGVTKNLRVAKKYFNRGCKLGDKPACQVLKSLN